MHEKANTTTTHTSPYIYISKYQQNSMQFMLINLSLSIYPSIYLSGCQEERAYGPKEEEEVPAHRPRINIYTCNII